MGQFITLSELLLIFIICFPVFALVKTIIQTLEDKLNNQ